MPEPETPPEQEIVVDGEPVELDDLTFREQRELRQTIAGMTGKPINEIELDMVDLMDFLPTLAWIIKRRTDPDYSMESALELKQKDMLRDKPKRPTRAAKKAA